MAGESQTTFKVFYSWQADLHPETNQRFIRTALKTAAQEIRNAPENRGLILEVDEATRGEAGSPNIPLTILRKIASSDAFVCDITTINARVPTDHRKVPNPNVVFELGYAVALLGWSRIVLLFNTAHGTFPGDLPFDFDRHRASTYRAFRCPQNDPTAKESYKKAEKDLIELCRVALEQIVVSNPDRPAQINEMSPEDIKRKRDVETLRYLLTQLHFDTLEAHTQNVPHIVTDRIFYFWEGFHACWTSALTHIYDKKLREILQKLHDAWHITLSFGEDYQPTGSYSYVFSSPGDLPLSRRQMRDWKAIEKAAKAFQRGLATFADKIRAEYLEIDLNKTNADAWGRYLRFSHEVSTRLGFSEK